MERRRIGIIDRLRGLGNRKIIRRDEQKNAAELGVGTILIQDNPEEKYVAYINNAFGRGIEIFALIGASDERFSKATRVLNIMCNDYGFTEKTGDLKAEDINPSKFKAFIFVVDARIKK